MNTYYKSALKQTYHRYFTSLRGIDLASDPSEVSLSHFAHLENMWRDPMTPDGVATETSPGTRVFARFGAPIYGIYRHRAGGEDHLVVHAGNALYRFPERLRNFEITLACLSPLPITVASVRGCAFAFGEKLYLLIGGEYIFISEAGDVSTLFRNPLLAYVPTTYFNGEPYEQRNLLSPLARLRFTADGDYEEIAGEEALVFSVFNKDAKTCAVRIAESARGSGRIAIPAAVTIGTDVFRVVAIAPRGFANMPALSAIDIPATVTIIGASAFLGDSALRYINISDDATSIGKEAFFGCLSLCGIRFGTALHSIGAGAFDYCEALSEVRYGGTEEQYASIHMEGTNTLRERDITTLYENDYVYEVLSTVYRYPLHEPAIALASVKLNDAELNYNYTKIDGILCRYQGISDGTYFTHIEITVDDPVLLSGKTLTVTVSAEPVYFTAEGEDGSPSFTGKEAFLGCTAVTGYDGRLFFTGNPRFPNTVFYTSLDETGRNNPLYLGALNYFNDGSGSVPNRGFVITGGLLAVCKADTGGEGAIFLHTPKDIDSDLLPRIYPVSATIPGVGICGCTVNFADEALFLGRHGLSAIVRCDTQGERALSHRSTAIDLRLLRENIQNAEVAIFEGMLFLLCEGNVYVADAERRTVFTSGAREYEWYFLSGIGSYAADRPVYRYSTHLPEGSETLSVAVSPREGEIAEGEIHSATLPDGKTLYYALNEEGCFSVDTDGERTGGVFSPATFLLATDSALYFGTAEGGVGCFNTDKRGLAMYRSVPSDLYVLSGEEYLPLSTVLPKLFSEDMLKEMTVYEKSGDAYIASGVRRVFLDGGIATLADPIEAEGSPGRMHRYYYSHSGHAYTASCVLAMDDGGLPHFAKDSVSQSATVKLKCPEGCDVSVSVRTDRHPFREIDLLRGGCTDAGNSDFSAFDFHGEAFASLSLREKERGWCYKQYRFESRGFRAPFGIFSLTYSFRPAGRIKP